ncbi:hypothetical protein ACYSUO_06010 [Streptomyces sp. UC4497]
MGVDVQATVRRIHRLLADALRREPRVLPAVFAQVLARPGDTTVQAMFQRIYPRLLNGIGQWLAEEIDAGRVRDLPPLLLIQQMVSPVVLHFLLRPSIDQLDGVDLPGTDDALEAFTQNFLRAVAAPRPPVN